MKTIKDLDHRTQAAKLFDDYLLVDLVDDSAAMTRLDDWLTEDLVRLYHLIDVELQERAFNANFESPFDEIQDDFGPPDEY